MIEEAKRLLSRELILIGDRRRVGTGEKITRHYAGTGELLNEVHMGSPSDIDEAVDCAHTAFPAWRDMAPSARREVLLRSARLLGERAERLGHIAALDAGLVAESVSWFAKHAADWLSYYAGWVDKDPGTTFPVGPDALDYVRNEPYGVVGVISPSNSSVSGMILAPLLAAGNCAVMKPSEFTAQVTAEFLQVFLDAGLPPGVLNCVPGRSDAGEALVRNPKVAKVHFTGSCAVGARVASLAGTLYKPVALELGGKSANIIFQDADLDRAAELAMRALVRQTGQSCVAGTRVLVHDSIADEVLARTVARTRLQKIGDPMAAGVAVGPVVSAAARDRIMGVIERARMGEYGRLAIGGDRAGGVLADGYFINPTIFADVDNASPLAQQETFGPVISFIRFRDDDEAVALANDSEFGLAAYIQTADLRRAHRTAHRLEVGTIWVNGAVGILAGGPFGGAKNSGYGRVGGLEGLREFTRPKNIWVGL